LKEIKLALRHNVIFTISLYVSLRRAADFQMKILSLPKAYWYWFRSIRSSFNSFNYLFNLIWYM